MYTFVAMLVSKVVVESTLYCFVKLEQCKDGVKAMNSKINRRYGVHIIDLYNLHCLVEGLVELGDLGGNTEVNGTVTDLDDDTTDQIRVDLFSVSVDDTKNDTGIGVHTLVTTLSFLPWLYSDLATAFSRREMLLLSSSYLTVSFFCTFKTQKGKEKKIPEHW